MRLATSGGRQLSAARISGGDIVGVRRHGRSAEESGGTLFVEGVVTGLDETSISISLDDFLPDVDDPSALFLVLKLTSNVTHKRFTAGLDGLERAFSDPTHIAHALVQVLLGGRAPRFTEAGADMDDSLLGKLNDLQRKAVRCAANAKDLAVVHGPPGTGKTHTIVAYILAEVARGNRVLVVAPSNVAVDNIAERLAKSEIPVKFVRAGHPARILPSVIEHSLDSLVLKTDEAALARDIRTELDDLESKIRKTKERGSRKALRSEQRELRKDLRKRERLAVKRLLTQMSVVLSTISGAGARVLDIAENVMRFDVVVIDEAAQALEAACWVPILRAKKAVLAGDPYQLAGTVKSVEAESRGLKTSILDRVFSTPGLQLAVTMLCTQYRMNNVISSWSSQEFYSGNLVADSSVASHRLGEMDTCKDDVDDDQNLVHPFILIDTAGGDCEEDDLSEEISQDASLVSNKNVVASRSNKGEAEIICRIVDQFISYGVPKKGIAVISPYSGQVEVLRSLLWPTHGRTLEVATIDSFQGREKEVVCMSLVRSNERGNVGFLSDDRRLNVAITRARRCVLIVCDSETVSTHPLLQRMVEYAENHGHYRSAVVDFPDIVGTYSQQRRPKEAIDADGQSAVKKMLRRKGNIAKNASGDISNTKARTGGTKPKVVVTVDDAVDFRARLREEMQSFVNNKFIVEKTYPSELSSMGRRFVHELAEELDLNHQTSEVAVSRQIRIWKRGHVKKLGNGHAEASAVGEGVEEVREESTMHAAGGMFDLLGDTELEDTHSGSEEANPTVSSVSPPLQHEDINSLLRRVSQAPISEGEAGLQDSEVAPSEAASSAVTGQPGKKKKKKRRGRNQKSGDSDDDFDAVLAKYGANPESSGAGKSGKKDLVQQIIDGKITLGPPPPRVNKQAKQRLAAKLSEEQEKRMRKPKKK